MIPEQILETPQAKASMNHDLASRVTLQPSTLLTTEIEPDEYELILRNHKHDVNEGKHQHRQKRRKGDASESVQRFQILEICEGSVGRNPENHETSNHLYSLGEFCHDCVLLVHAGNNVDHCDEGKQRNKDEFDNQRERVRVDDELQQDHDLDTVRQYLSENVVGIVGSGKTHHHCHCANEEPHDCIFEEIDFPYADCRK